MSRPKIRKAGKKKALKAKQKDLEEKVFLFDKLPDQCLSCEKPFDKKDKEMVAEWTVVVRKEQNRVNLWCPECWQKAHELFIDFAKDRIKNEPQPE